MKKASITFLDYINETSINEAYAIDKQWVSKELDDFNRHIKTPTQDDYKDLAEAIMKHLSIKTTPEKIESTIDFLQMNWEDYEKFDKREYNTIINYFWTIS